MSNSRFEVGSSITWLDWVSDAMDNEGHYYIAHGCLTGTVLRITPHTVLVQIKAHNGLVEKRFDKHYLAENVFDEEKDIYDRELREAILSTVGQSEKEMNDTTPYTVYALSDPCTGIIHYIGISKNVQLRYKQHCTCSGINLKKNLWIVQLLQKNQRPILSTLEVVKGSKAARKRESVWIHHYQSLGIPLTNIDGVKP